MRLWVKIAHAYADGDSNGNTDSNSDRHANSYGDSDRHTNCQPHCNNIGNSYAATDANTQVAPNGQATRNASAQAIEFRRAGNSC